MVERRPLVYLMAPAHVHHGIELLWTVQRLFQPLEVGLVNSLKDLEDGYMNSSRQPFKYTYTYVIYVYVHISQSTYTTVFASVWNE